MDKTCKGRCLAFYKNPEVLVKNWPRSSIKLNQLYGATWPFFLGASKLFLNQNAEQRPSFCFAQRYRTRGGGNLVLVPLERPRVAAHDELPN